MAAVVSITGLIKNFGHSRALDGLDLDVREGEVHGFLGPNGAGKSTTLRILLGLLRADAGTVRVLGGDPWRDVVTLHRRIAYVPGDVSLWPGLTGGEAIDLLGRLRGGLEQSRRTELLDAFELDPSIRGHAYSKGNRQKVAIVAALSSNAELLILDEPTSGLDPLMEATFRREIRHEKAKGRSVLLSSHILAEVESLADRISIIRKGKVVETGSLEQMRSHARSNVAATLNDGAARNSASSRLAAVPGVESVHAEGSRLRFSVDDAALAAVMGVLSDHGMSALTVTPPSLEDLFLQHYGERLAPEELAPEELASEELAPQEGRKNDDGAPTGPEPARVHAARVRGRHSRGSPS